MTIRVRKKEKESNDKLYNRFNKKVQSSRILNEVKDKKYFVKKESKRHARQAAIMREFYRKERKRKQFYS